MLWVRIGPQNNTHRVGSDLDMDVVPDLQKYEKSSNDKDIKNIETM